MSDSLEMAFAIRKTFPLKQEKEKKEGGGKGQEGVAVRNGSGRNTIFFNDYYITD